MVGPKEETSESQGSRFHAKEELAVVGGTLQPFWTFEESGTIMAPTAMILVRVVVAKVVDIERLRAILRGVPVRLDQPGWNCVAWVKEALQALYRDGRTLGTAVSSWDEVRDAAMQYVDQKKREHRFDGQGTFDPYRVATLDMLEGKEVSR